MSWSTPCIDTVITSFFKCCHVMPLILMLASCSGHVAIVQLFISNGAEMLESLTKG